MIEQIFKLTQGKRMDEIQEKLAHERRQRKKLAEQVSSKDSI